MSTFCCSVLCMAFWHVTTSQFLLHSYSAASSDLTANMFAADCTLYFVLLGKCRI